MEVASGGSGGPTVSTEPEALTDSSRTKLNISLWVAVLVAAAVVIYLGSQMWDQHADDGGGVLHRVGRTLVDSRSAPAVELGDDVGKGVVARLPESSDADQERLASILETGSKLVTAFLNIEWKHPETSFDAVRSMATGAFKKQYDKSTKSLATLAKRVHSVEKGEVVWAGYVGGDKNSATMVLATSGTVTSNVTKHQPQARFYRIQLDLTKVGSSWLVNNLQFVS